MMDIVIKLFNDLVVYIKNHFKKIMILLISGGCLIALVAIYQSYTFVTLTVSTKALANKNVTIATYANSAYSSTKIGSSGLQFVPRSAKSITVSVGDSIKTEVPLTPPWYRFTSVDVDLKPDTNATKVAYETTVLNPCATYDKEREKLLSYDCNTPASLVKYDTPADNYWMRTVVNKTDFSTYSPPVSYLNGLIGLHKTRDPSKAIIYYDGNGDSKTYNAPPTIDISTFEQSQIFTDASRPQDTRFALVTKNGDIYTAVPNENNSSVSYTRYKAPEKYDPVFQHTLCDVTDGSVLCYRGYMQVGDVTNPRRAGAATISTGQFGSQTMKTRSVPQDYLDTIHLAGDGTVYGLDQHVVYSFGKQDTDYSAVTIAQAALFAASGKDFYIIQDAGVYKVSGATLTQVFYSKNIKPTSLYISGDQLYILAKAADQTTTSAYLLNNTPNNTPGQRVIDLYPTVSNNIPDAQIQDLVENRAYITLLPRQDIQADYSLAKNRIIANLQTLGVDTNTLDIKVTY